MIVIAIMSVTSVLVLSKFDTPLGIRAFSVLSGSMEPTIPTGSLVIVRDTGSYEVGDVLTVLPSGPNQKTITHRVDSIQTNEESGVTGYWLKGDANENVDREIISEGRVVGEVTFHVPYVGRLIGFAQSQTGFIVMIIMPATILAYNEIMTIKTEVQKILAQRKSNSIAQNKPEKAQPALEAATS